VDLIGFLSNHGIKFQAKLYQCVWDDCWFDDL
jgi:hypothetical protein